MDVANKAAATLLHRRHQMAPSLVTASTEWHWRDVAISLASLIYEEQTHSFSTCSTGLPHLVLVAGLPATGPAHREVR